LINHPKNQKENPIVDNNKSDIDKLINSDDDDGDDLKDIQESPKFGKKAS
jgi:hypothetical protein